MLQLEVPGGGKSVLLHSCCAPCSGAVLECLVANGIKPVVFFSNSNIVPREEYELRLRELQRYCDSLGVPLVEDAWDHDAWLDFVLQRGEGDEALTKALASAPERGPRCLNCFKFRLLRAAKYAAAQGISVLTTTLAPPAGKASTRSTPPATGPAATTLSGGLRIGGRAGCSRGAPKSSVSRISTTRPSAAANSQEILRLRSE